MHYGIAAQMARKRQYKTAVAMYIDTIHRALLAGNAQGHA